MEKMIQDEKMSCGNPYCKCVDCTCDPCECTPDEQCACCGCSCATEAKE